MTTPDTLPATQSGMTEAEISAAERFCQDDPHRAGYYSNTYPGMLRAALAHIRALQSRISEIERERDDLRARCEGYDGWLAGMTELTARAESAEARVRELCDVLQFYVSHYDAGNRAYAALSAKAQS